MSQDPAKQDKKTGDHKTGSEQKGQSGTDNQTPKEENEPRDRKK